ncbi:MAG: acetyl-CoA C-acetyltransferase [Xanthomonadales bacterium]|nr:3-ketoacyl-CoA thiolase FadI [Xanthomonadales bacterium]MCC6593955.1 acetyl-CoA C-acetyltransferase [Xanthomonadales bacterium]MCE7932338.1 acetyl-CoA C-acetyltransferase [Xanthomonadales bacterium PRO6]
MSGNGPRAAILGGLRIPFCRSNTSYADLPNLALGTELVSRLVERFDLKGVELGELAFGAVLKHSRDWNLAREIALGCGLKATTPGLTLQRACGTGFESAIVIANKIALRQIRHGIAGGSDSASEVPLVLNQTLNARFLALARARSSSERLRAFKGFRLGELKPVAPTVGEPRTGKSMGEHCEMMAKAWAISRVAQDQVAFDSHQKAHRAYERGFYDDLTTPFRGLRRDGVLRADTTLEKLASLKPAFDRNSGHGTLTAGNSTPLTDGASALLLADADWARAEGREVLAELVDAEVAAVDFVAGEGLLMAPTVAVSRLLQRQGLGLAHIDLFEIHEAFAAQLLCTLAAFESESYCRERLGLPHALGAIDRSRLNVAGGSLAIGHPFAATGARMLAGVAKLLQERGGGRALVTACAAGGMGVAVLLERK